MYFFLYFTAFPFVRGTTCRDIHKTNNTHNTHKSRLKILRVLKAPESEGKAAHGFGIWRKGSPPLRWSNKWSFLRCLESMINLRNKRTSAVRPSFYFCILKYIIWFFVKLIFFIIGGLLPGAGYETIFNRYRTCRRRERHKEVKQRKRHTHRDKDKEKK